MKKCFAILAAIGLGCATLPSAAADSEPWMCCYKGYTEAGQYYYIVVHPFEGDADQSHQLNSSEFAQGLFDDLAPGKRFSGERACAQRPREVTEKWFKKLLAGDDMFSGPNNTTLGRMARYPHRRAALAQVGEVGEVGAACCIR